MTPQEKKQLQVMACKVRMGVIEGVHAAKSGHPGGSLSAADMFTYLYFKELRVDPENPHWEDRDRFVLSKGHTAPGLYAALALRGFFPVEDLVTLRKLGSYLQGHPNMNSVPGVDMSTGSLGQGISVACGMALASRLKKRDNRVYTLLGDGEIQEGQVWEACMFAAHYKLDNLCVIIDNNGLQIDGATRDVMNSEPLDHKMDAFGFNTIVCNGNSFADLEQAFRQSTFCWFGYENGQLIAVARAISDCTWSSYLADVAIVPARQGQGYGQQLMLAIREQLLPFGKILSLIHI